MMHLKLDMARSAVIATTASITIVSAGFEARADHADRAQCTCEPQGTHYSGITNARLCVLTPGGGDPYCNVQVYCLSDGSGSGCEPHGEAIEAAEEAAAVGRLDLTKFVQASESFLGEHILMQAEYAYEPFKLLMANISAQEQQLLLCFAALGRGEREPVTAEGEGVHCYYEPRFHLLTLHPPGQFPDNGFPAIQIVSSR